MAGIETRKDRVAGKYRVHWREGRTKRSQSFDYIGPAERFARAVEDAGERCPDGYVMGQGWVAAGTSAAEQRTFADVWTAFIVTKDHLRCKGAQQRSYVATYTRHWHDTWGGRDITTITVDEVAAWQRGVKLAAKTVADRRSLLWEVFNFARRRGWVAINPVDLVPRIRRKSMRVKTDDYFTVEQFRYLREAMDPEGRDVIAFAAATGLRWSELTALSPRHIRDGWVNVESVWKRDRERLMAADGSPLLDGQGNPQFGGEVWFLGPPKNGEPRQIPLSATMAEIVNPRSERTFLFDSPSGGRLWSGNFRDRYWIPATRKAAAHLPPNPRFHMLRHTFAWWALSAGTPIAVVSRWLGHASIQITVDTYGGIENHALVQAATLMDGVMSSALKKPVSKVTRLRPDLAASA